MDEVGIRYSVFGSRLSAFQYLRQGGGKKQHIRRGGARSHQPNPPDLAGQWPKAGTDLDVELLQQRLAYGGLVHTIGDADGVQRPQSFAGARQQREAEMVERARERLVIFAMTGVARLESLFLDCRHRLPQRQHQRRRDGVVILATDPIILEQREIEVEAAARRAALERRGGEGDRRESGWRAESLLRARITDGAAPRAHVNGHRPE